MDTICKNNARMLDGAAHAFLVAAQSLRQNAEEVLSAAYGHPMRLHPRAFLRNGWDIQPAEGGTGGFASVDAARVHTEGTREPEAANKFAADPNLETSTVRILNLLADTEAMAEACAALSIVVTRDPAFDTRLGMVRFDPAERGIRFSCYPATGGRIVFDVTEETLKAPRTGDHFAEIRLVVSEALAKANQ